MIKVEEKYDISQHLTMKVASVVDYFATIRSKEELFEAIDFANEKGMDIFVLGGGSNTIVTKKLNKLVVKNEIKGTEIISEDDNEVVLELMSGESWMKLVNYSVSNNWYGLENLASIYGTVGAAPIQNIGAYGAEFSQVFSSLIAYDLKTKEEITFNNSDCHFGYRDSVFKNKYKGKLFIYSLRIKLKKKADLNIEYKALKDEIEKLNTSSLLPKDVAMLVNKIRNEKLPNPSVLPNSGSFFKNPEISIEHLEKIKEKYPDIVSYKTDVEGVVKVPAAYLIEKSGYKGKRVGPVSMYEKQALILANHDNASVNDLVNLVNLVQDKVKNEFAIDLEPEVNII